MRDGQPHGQHRARLPGERSSDIGAYPALEFATPGRTGRSCGHHGSLVSPSQRPVDWLTLAS